MITKRVGNLRSVLIKSLNGTSYWDLNTNDLYLDEGRIHGKNFDLNMKTGEINISGNATMTGAGLSLNFNTGYIYSKHGKFGNDTTYYDLDSQVLHGDNIDINLKTGYVKMQQGKIGNDSCYFDISNQRIHGDRVDINLKDGTNNLLQAGTVGSTNGRTNLNLNDGTAKIGNFSVGQDNKVQISDGCLVAKDGNKYCRVDAGKISWNDGTRMVNNNIHTYNVDGKTNTIESLDLIGNTPGGVSLSNKSGSGIVNTNSDSVYASYRNCEMYLGIPSWSLGTEGCKIWGMLDIIDDPLIKNSISIDCEHLSINGDLFVDNTLYVHGDFSVADGKKKSCIVNSPTYGRVEYYCTEDLYYLLTYTPINKYYMTKKNDKGYYSIAIRIPKMVQETIRTDMEYNVYVTPYTAEDGTPLFARYNVGNRNKDYFVVYSDSPMRFKFKLEARRNKLENADLEHQLEDYNEPIITNKNNKKLQSLAGNQWKEYGECFEG